MEDMTLAHPDPAQLTAFGRGTLDEETMAEVEGHLAACRACCQALDGLGDDDFVELLRVARNRSDLTTGFFSAASLSPTAPTNAGATVFEVPSSFEISRSDFRSRLEATISAGGISGPGTRELPLEDELPPELLDHPRYEIVRKLGAGGMGSVYLAHHRLMDRPVALKVIRRNLLGNAAMVERFRREVKSAARMALHPNIVVAYDAEQAADSHFLVMEFVEGVDLGHLVKFRGLLPIEEACDAIKQAAEGLEHAHQRGMVHRDIKPQNLMRTPEGQIKILDFGLARLASEAIPEMVAAAEEQTEPDAQIGASSPGIRVTLTHMVLGSADYIAPEQAIDPRSADIRADIYSLGCTLYYLLGGRPPFPEGNLAQKLTAHAERTPKPLAEIRPDVPAELGSVVDRMMAKDRSERFQRPAEVVQALGRFCGVTKPAAVDSDAFHYNETRRSVDINASELDKPTSPFGGTEGAQVVFSPPLSFSSKSPWRRSKVAALLGLLTLCVGALGITTFRIITDKGKLIIDSGHHNVQVIVEQSGTPVTIIDTKTKSQIDLHSGQYTLQLAGGAPGLLLSTSAFTLRRGDTRVVTVRHVPAVDSTASDPPIVIRLLKEATVFIKAKVKGRYLSTGTGFVIADNGNEVLLATNRHVAVPNLSGVPESIAPRDAPVETDAVFYSGEGPQLEQVLPAGIVAVNLSEDINTDLAFMVVQGVKRPPRPIDIFARLEPAEGIPYVCAGFPLSDLVNKIADAHGNPTITITHGYIASLKKDEQGQISLLQVEGALHPGNSGGPVVDEKSGRLLGVAVASLTRTGLTNVGFIVPAAEVRRCMDGRVGAVDLTLNEIQAGSADLLVKAQVVDPTRKVQGVMVFVASSSSVGAIFPLMSSSWPPLPNIFPVELEWDDAKQTAQGRVKVSLTGQGPAARKVLIQTAHYDARGVTIYSKPKEIVLPEKPGPIRLPGSIERLIAPARKPSFALLGPLTDPDKDCKLVKEEAGFKIRLELPGNKIHTLSPEVVTSGDKRKPLHNAPMTLTDVDGDFVATVEITGDMNAGTTLPKDRQGNQIQFTFQGAGLLLYQDKNNFVRLERTAGTVLDSLAAIHKVLIEVVQEGKTQKSSYFPLLDGDTRLVLIRRKGKLRCQFGPKSGNPFITPSYVVDLAPKVKIGLSAANVSSKPFTANFENFVLLNDATTIEEKFGE
jgi:serine/threonine protein kinase/S1-C subfamily serine protease